MKNCRRLVWCLFLLLPLVALKCKKDDIVKASKFDVTIRVTGEHLDGLGAEIRVNSTLNILKPSTGPALTYNYGSTVAQTYALGTFGLQDQVMATVAFHNVTCGGIIQPASDSKLRLEILVNGVLVNYVELTPASRGGSFTCSPYWLNTTESESEDWD